MKFVQLRCPNCNANLEIESTLDTCYCQYCGTKIMLTEQDDNVINAKVRMYEIDAETERKRDQLEHELKLAEKRPGCLATILNFYLSLFKIMVVLAILMIIFYVILEFTI